MRKPDQSSNAGNLEEVADWGRLFLGYFLLAKQKKVTSRRATPGEVDFDVGLREKTANPTYTLLISPSLHQSMLHPQMIQYPCHHKIHQVLHCLRLIIKSRIGR